MTLSKFGGIHTQKEGYMILQTFELRKLEGIFFQKRPVLSALKT
jgi:hypothetical protein